MIIAAGKYVHIWFGQLLAVFNPNVFPLIHNATVAFLWILNLKLVKAVNVNNATAEISPLSYSLFNLYIFKTKPEYS